MKEFTESTINIIKRTLPRVIFYNGIGILRFRELCPTIYSSCRSLFLLYRSMFQMWRSRFMLWRIYLCRILEFDVKYSESLSWHCKNNTVSRIGFYIHTWDFMSILGYMICDLFLQKQIGSLAAYWYCNYTSSLPMYIKNYKSL